MSKESDIDAARDYYDTHSMADKIDSAVPGDPASTSAMSGYSVRLPTDVLNRARKLASERGMTTGAWLREAIEKQVSTHSRATEAARTPGAPAYELVHDLINRFMTDVLSAYDDAIDVAWSPLGMKVDKLRDWNAAHLHSLNVDSLVAGGGGIGRWVAPNPSAQGQTEATADKKPAVKSSGSGKFYIVNPVVRSGRRIRTKDAAPALRRRRRTIT
ncbi:hypothetical protein ACWDXV_33910 [Nocardia nova]